MSDRYDVCAVTRCDGVPDQVWTVEIPVAVTGVGEVTATAPVPLCRYHQGEPFQWFETGLLRRSE